MRLSTLLLACILGIGLFNMTFSKNYIKSNGMRVGQKDVNYFFVGPSGGSVRTGFNTEQPNELLDFNKGQKNFFYFIPSGVMAAATADGDPYSFVIDSREMLNLPTDRISFATGRVGQSPYLTDYRTINSLYFSSQFVGVFSAVALNTAANTVRTSPDDDEAPFAFLVAESTTLDSETFKPDVQGSFFYEGNYLGMVNLGQLGDVPQRQTLSFFQPRGGTAIDWTLKTIHDSWGINTNGMYVVGKNFSATQLYARPAARRGKSAAISFGFEYNSDNENHYFAIYVDGQPLYFEEPANIDFPYYHDSNNKIQTDGTGSNAVFVLDEGAPSAKTFIIPHPTTSNRYLVHATLEGPDARVFYYGTQQLKEGQCVVTLPDYFESLTQPKGRHVFVSAVDGDDAIAVKDGVTNGQFVIFSDNKTSNQRFNWRVTAIRSDVSESDVEPLKSSINVSRKGPYTYEN